MVADRPYFTGPEFDWLERQVRAVLWRPDRPETRVRLDALFGAGRPVSPWSDDDPPRSIQVQVGARYGSQPLNPLKPLTPSKLRPRSSWLRSLPLNKTILTKAEPQSQKLSAC